MDLVTQNLLNTFKSEQGFADDIALSTLFEHFANYCVALNEYSDEFDVEDILVAGGNDLQLDGVAILANGVLVGSTDEVDDLITTNKYLDVEFIFIQAKSGKGFEGAEISNMFYGVRELLDTNPTLPRNNTLAKKEQLIKHIYSKSASFRHGNPKIRLYYVTTGKWHNDAQLLVRVAREVEVLEDLNIFQEVKFEPVDARKLQQYFNRAHSALSKTFTFANKVTLPTMDGVRESYLGFIPVTEYLDIITDENGNLLRGLFYDNVRDYQGANPVNEEIEQTLQSPSSGAFVLLNNGITIVAEDLSTTGNTFTLHGFQIVNGCQTSHVLFNNRGGFADNIHISTKLIVAPEGELKNQVIKATNRQTVVKTEELSALTDFQKHLEEYYEAIPEAHKLYYERRSQQYWAVPGLEKIRIIPISSQIRSFASMFVGRAHQASRYYGTLLKDVEGRIFIEGHSPIAYYISSYSLFRIETLLRRRQIDNKYRPFKYHLLGLVRMQVAGTSMPAMTSNQFEKYCDRLKEVLWDDNKCLQAIQDACALLDTVLSGNYDRDKAKDSSIEFQARTLINTDLHKA